jgi:hypothetical protein
MIEGFDGKEGYTTEALEELFTLDEAEALKAYLDKRHDGAGTTDIVEVKLPIPFNSAGFGAHGVGRSADFYMLDRDEGYDLPFRAWAYYDLANASNAPERFATWSPKTDLKPQSDPPPWRQ